MDIGGGDISRVPRSQRCTASYRELFERRAVTLPRPIVCDSLRRLGAPHDGGYVVPIEAIERASRLLSFGLGMDWSFERAATRLNPNLRVDVYDPYVQRRRFRNMRARSLATIPLRVLTLSPRRARSSWRKAALANDYFRFFSGAHRHHEQRIWYNGDNGSASIVDVIESASVDGSLSLFTKIDIEGSEYRILPAICSYADLFTGLVIEFHNLDICADLFMAQMGALQSTFDVVHLHGNNHGDLGWDGRTPLSLEISLLNKRLLKGDAILYEGPLPRPGLDAPNDRNRPDYVLDVTQWPFEPFTSRDDSTSATGLSSRSSRHAPLS